MHHFLQRATLTGRMASHRHSFLRLGSVLAISSGIGMLLLWVLAGEYAHYYLQLHIVTAPSSAVTLMLAGLCLLLLTEEPTPLRHGVLLGGAITLIGIGGTTIAAELIRPDLRLPLDSFLAPPFATPDQVRQLPVTGFNAALFGLALILMLGTRWHTMLSQILALIILLNSLRDLTLTSVALLNDTIERTSTDPLVSLNMALLTLSLLRQAPPPQLLHGLRRAGPSGYAVRLLLVPALAIPIMADLISRWEARTHAFGFGFETLLLIGLNIGLIWWFAESLADSERLRLRADRARIESEQRLKLITDQMPAILWSTDRNLRIVAIHGSVLNPLSIDPAHYLGRDVSAIVGNDEAGRIAVQAHHSALNGAPDRYERTVGKRAFDVQVEPLRDQSGRIVGAVSLALDITERQEMESAIHQLNSVLEQRVAERTRQLEAVNEELEAFCYSVSHDLRAPLRSIDGFSQALLEDYAERLDAEGRDHLERVRKASQRMAGLIDDLLALSRVTRSTLERRSVNLSAMAEAIVAELRRSDPHRNVQITIQPDLWDDVDCRLMDVALTNLLENAWKFTSRQQSATITFQRITADDTPFYQLSDNGAGFAMAYARRLFQPFQRLHNEREFSGTGIGLATVKRVITRHGGRIWATSAPNQGATFAFTLQPALEYTQLPLVDSHEDVHGV